MSDYMQQVNEPLNYKQYKIIKERAYRLAAKLSEQDLTKEQFAKIANETSFLNETEEIIYKTTLYYPNDLEILQQREIGKESGNKNNINYLSKQLHIPFSVITMKMQEYQNNDIIKLLEQNPELRQLATQAPYFDIHNSQKQK